MTRIACAVSMVITVLLVGCGGGGGGSSTSASTASTATTPSPTDNVVAVSVNGGPTGQFVNSVMTSVTICVPGTNDCQTIPNVQVDTGSTGLRLLASVVTIPLPAVRSGASGSAYSECTDFADGVTWGAVAAADIKLAGESAAGISIQLIQDNAATPAVPDTCAAKGTAEDSLASLGANGILGVGVFLQDCGAYCASTSDAYYYVCTGANCAEATIPVSAQVSNPVAAFATDNNGVLLQLPAIPASGAASVDGSLIFGIGTQSNNGLSGTVLSVPTSGTYAATFTATYKGVALPASFIDSGSTQLYFDDSSIVTCSGSSPIEDLSPFYCPGSTAGLSTLALPLTLAGTSGVTASVSLPLADAQYLFAQPGGSTFEAFDDLGGPTGTSYADAFDFGVPFFFGRSVFTAFEQRSTPSGSGPYYAYQAYP